MTDGTHSSPDGRGVNRTSLFENLVVTCTRACIALGDLELIFEDLFQAYDDAGIAPIYLEQFETFVLEHDVRTVDPCIAQQLIGLHAANGRPDRAERVIWHIDPVCLDIDQAVQDLQLHLGAWLVPLLSSVMAYIQYHQLRMQYSIRIPGFASEMMPIALSQADAAPATQSAQSTKKGVQVSPAKRH